MENQMTYTFLKYEADATRTINRNLLRIDIIRHAVFEICSEAGEIAGLFQKVYQGHEIEDEHLMKEIGDVLWGLNELCIAWGEFSLGECAMTNIEKLKARYPNGFSAEQSLHRKNGDV